MAETIINGYKAYYDENCNEWKYFINNKSIISNLKTCPHCGKDQTIEGHDGCLGTLTGVLNACCGHGDIDETYVQLLDGSILRGEKAMKFIKENKER